MLKNIILASFKICQTLNKILFLKLKLRIEIITIEKKIPRKEQKNAEQTLKDLQSWCSKFEPEGRLNIYNFPNHQKLLISDEKYMVCGSFNWLSNSGYSNNVELSVGLIDQEIIKKKTEQVIEFLSNYLN